MFSIFEKLNIIDDNLDESILLEARGQEELRKFICELINSVCKTVLNPNDYMIHHKDGDHKNNHPKNIVLLPVENRAQRTLGVVPKNASGKILKNSNTSIHNQIKTDNWGVFDPNLHDKYASIIDNYHAVDVWRSIMRRQITFLNKGLLKRDLNKSIKNPTGRIK